MSVKTRFAPSPTGSLHIGGARTALFSWLFARHEGGEFVLRVEDTDSERSDEKFFNEITDSLRWLGIEWDGAPLRQSARLDIYKEYAEKLLASGAAFKCYMTPEDLEAERKSAEASGGHFRYKREWAERGKKEDGAPFALRFAVPRVQDREDNPLSDSSGEIIFTDLLRGNMSFSSDDIEDFVIMRPDGMPTYNFACAVDDALCEITHVIRGDEHLVNTPKQILLLKALGLPIPAFVHLPVILAPDGSKLSKRRHGGLVEAETPEADLFAQSVVAQASVEEWREKGFLPSGLANYIARLGWSHGDEEIFTISELIEKFDIRGLGVSPSHFDDKKMHWVNGVHIREGKADVVNPLREQLSQKLSQKKNYVSIFNDEEQLPQKRIYVSPQDAKKAFELLKERAETIIEMAEKSVFLFTDEVDGSDEYYVKKKFLNPQTLPALEAVLSALSKPDTPFNIEGLKTVFSAITEETGLKMKQIAQPLRVALTGRTESPGIYEVVSALGREKTVSRVEKAIKIAKAAVIGLCGNLCSGKSTVAEILSEFGACVIDADKISRLVTEHYSEHYRRTYEQIVGKFGSGVVGADGKIDREKLGAEIFSDAQKRKDLEAITHPVIGDGIAVCAAKAAARGAKAVVIEAALLSRDGRLGEIIDHLVLVDASEEKKIERMVKRDGFDETEAKKRLKSQEGRNPDWDYIIDNSGGLEELKEKVKGFWEEII